MQTESPEKPCRSRKDRPQRDGMIGAARQLRSNPTEAEKMLWEALRRKQAGGMRFRRQRVIGPYVVDFCCLSHGLVVEVDGAHHHDSEHSAYDADRTAFLEAHGFRVLRFDNAEVMADVARMVAKINSEDGRKGTIPSPALPSVEGEEESDPYPPAPFPSAEGQGENDPHSRLLPAAEGQGETTEPSHPRTGERAG